MRGNRARGIVLIALTACSSQADSSRELSVPRIELEEIVRIGSVDGPEELRFTRAGPLTVDPSSGEIVVGDPGSGTIRVFDRHGEFLRTFGGRGEGPGELPDDQFVLDVARDTVLVLDRDRFVVFDRNGRHLETGRLEIDARLVLPMAVAADSMGWTMWAMDVAPDRPGETLERYYRIDLQDRELGDPFFEIVHRTDELGILSEQERAVPVGTGLISVPGPEYELLFYPRPGADPRILRFEVPPVPVPPTAFAEYSETERARCGEAGDPDRCLEATESRIERMSARPIPETRPVAGGLRGSRAGLVLVRRADLDPTPYENDDPGTWDLVSVDEGRVGSVEFSARFRPRWLGADEVWGFDLDALDVPYVVGYRMLRH